MNDVPGVDAESRDGRSLALVAQISIFAGDLLIVPLVVRLTSGKSNRFVRLHSTECLNARLTLLIWMVLFVPLALFAPDWWFVPWTGIYLIGIAYVYVVAVVGAIRAWRGTPWRYPVNARMVRG